jgi:two-component system OmpR family response regulator
MHHGGRVVSQGEHTERIYSEAADRDSNTVEVFIARLRRKLAPPSSKQYAGWGTGSRRTGDAAPTKSSPTKA